MKAKTLFLSSIILGGFVTPIIQTTTAKAVTIKTEVKEKQTNKSDQVENNQVHRNSEIKLGQKIDLKDLNAETSIVIPSTTKNEQNKLDNIYVNLDASQIKQLQDNKEVDFNVTDLKTKSPWGGKLEYQSVSPSMKLSFDETSQNLILTNSDNSTKLDHLTYILVNGDALVHYVYKDTNEEIYAGKHEDVFTNERASFDVELLEDFEDAPYPVGHFDALKIDFDALDPQDIPLNPLNPEFHEEGIKIDYDLNNINRTNTEYTVYLEKAKPMVIDFIVYLDDEVYDKKTYIGEVNTTIPVQTDEKLPDKSQAHLNNTKTKFTSSHDYFPQLGVSTMSGKAFHQTIFDRESKIPREKDFLNKTIFFCTDDNTADEPVNIEPSLTGTRRKMEIFYESNSNDENNSTDKTITADVTIKTNLGDKVVKKVTGKVGETIDVMVPEVEGYTADKATVKAKVNSNGEIVTEEKVTYTKNDNNNQGNENGGNKPGDNNANGNENGGNKPGDNNANGNENGGNKPGDNNNNGSSTVKPPITTPQPEKFDGFVGTMHKTVPLYNFKDGQMTLDKTKQLSEHSDWISDRIVTIDGIKYYRVATNEWAKATTVYRYEKETGVVDTKNAEITYLVKSDQSRVHNRGLSANTSWKYDRVAYLGDREEKHYRVATREFVHEQDVIKK